MLIDQIAPDFCAQACMPDDTFKEVKLSDYRGKHVILFFWPADFTFVCASEVPAFQKMLAEFKKRNCEILGVSCDTEHVHRAWKNTPLDKGGIGEVSYPMIADVTKEIAIAYDVLLKNGLATRGLFLIDKVGKVQIEMKNCLPIGRSLEEPLRLLDALQFHEQSVVSGKVQVCPAQWKLGKKGMTPTVDGVAAFNKDGGAAEYLK